MQIQFSNCKILYFLGLVMTKNLQQINPNQTKTLKNLSIFAIQYRIRVENEVNRSLTLAFVQKQFLDNINNFNMKGFKSIYKYNKVTQQQKFHLLTLVLHQKLMIKQAARIVRINYSTAKTILFFNRNSSKSYQFSFQNQSTLPEDHDTLQVSYKEITSSPNEDLNIKDQNPKVTIVSTIGNQKAACRLMIHKKQLLENYRTLRLRKESGYVQEEQLNNQQALNTLRIQRPRTRSQISALNYLHSRKLEHSEKDLKSSGVLKIQES